MGEAKRRRAAPPSSSARSWATGLIEVRTDRADCFTWSGTKQDAVDLQKRFIETINIASPIGCESYAKRAAAYLICWGMPQAGDLDRRPSSPHGRVWPADEVELSRAAILWLVMREHIPNTGQKIEDIFVGKHLGVLFRGDAQQVLDETARELRSEPFSGEEFQMIVGVLNKDYRLNPDDAVPVALNDIHRIAGLPPVPDDENEQIYAPRIPRSADEADAMLDMTIIFTDATKITPEIVTNPSSAIRTYVGYTQEELLRGSVGVSVR